MRHLLLRKLCIIAVFASIGASTAIVSAQERFRTDLLADMAKVLDVSGELDTLPDGCYMDGYSYRKKPLRIEVRDNEVRHIGYLMFSERQRAMTNPVVCNFLERYLLANDMPLERKKDLNKQLAEDEITFPVGSYDRLTKLVGDTTLNLTIENCNNKRYVMSWYKDDRPYCAVDFPIGYDLLNGTTMEENERRMASGLRNAETIEIHPEEVRREQLLTTWQPNYYVLQGTFYLLEQLNTNRYYEKNRKGDFVPIFSSKYPAESLANLLTTTEIKNKLNVDVCLKKYPFDKENLRITVTQFVSYFRQQGCKLYFGVKSMDEDVARCLLVAHNPAEGYCHTIDVDAPLNVLKEKSGSLGATVTCFVPTSKIKNLFAD